MCHVASGWTVPFKASPLALKANTGPSTGNIFNFSYHPNNKQETSLQFCFFHIPLATKPTAQPWRLPSPSPLPIGPTCTCTVPGTCVTWTHGSGVS